MAKELWSASDWRRRLAEELCRSGLEVAADGLDRLAAFAEFLQRENESLNLVSRKLASEALLRSHFVESLLGALYLPPPGLRRQLIDVGSGGGFPAIPLLAVRSDLDGVLVESTGKKCRFLRECVTRLGLTASVAEARFPDSFDMPRHPTFHLLTTRAVADAGMVVRQAKPWTRRPLRALLWTTPPLYVAAARASGCAEVGFHMFPGAERRGIGLLECST